MFKNFLKDLSPNLSPKRREALNSPLSANQENMTQENNSINSHIEAYLDYYCGLSAPGFAVLLKGEWGSGKTWFINDYRKKLKKDNQKCLYVSLYGKTSLSEIGNTLILQLIPMFSSREKDITMAGKVVTEALKSQKRFDLDKINVLEYLLDKDLKNNNNNILIFDDLERCQMDIGNILGYINSFVEHQGLKVIIIAHENKLLELEKYQSIKEKLIGKSFNIVLDFDGSLVNFICSVNNLDARTFLTDNAELIQEVYKTAECENLRILKQIVLDFERIFEKLPEKGRSKPEFLKDILKLLMAFSIEIRRGEMLPKHISKLEEEYKSLIKKQYHYRQEISSDIKSNSEELTKLEKMLARYTVLDINLDDPFPSKVWWEIFFDKGILNLQELEKSLLTSKYFQDENTPNWIRLWHFSDLTDDEFDDILKKLESEYADKRYTILGEIKHITGLLLMFSDGGLYCKTKEEILENSKLYIDWLKDNNKLDNASQFISLLDFNVYGGLGFQGIELKEFKEFCSYIDKVRELARVENLPNVARELLITMQSDIWKFRRMLCLSRSQNEDLWEQKYY